MTSSGFPQRAAILSALVALAVPLAEAQSAPPTPTALEAPDLVRQYQATITAEELAGHLYVFASDLFEGRETGTRGEELAALWLAGQHQAMGLTPPESASIDRPLDPLRYVLPFPLERRGIERARLSASGAAGAESVFGTAGTDGDQYALQVQDRAVSGGLVFAGYGIDAQVHGYSDFDALEAAGVSLAGRWVLMLDDEPLADDGTSLLTGGQMASGGGKSIGRANAMGPPAGFLVVGDSSPRQRRSVADRARQRADRTLLRLPPVEGVAEEGPGLLPFYVVSAALADRLLAPSGRTVTELRAEIDGALQPVVFEVDGVEVTSDVTRSVEVVEGHNVAAFVEGSDPVLKDEVVVVSAHLDHLGLTGATEGDRVNNGADDDGSGTVALLEIAEAFQRAKEDGHGPRRSVLFLHFSGEEEGLLGSEHYADRVPLVPMERTVVNLNLDMVGRPEMLGDPPAISIIGAELISTDLDHMNAAVNETTGVGLRLSKDFNSPDDPNRFFERSDHWNFGKHGVPFIFYFTGPHDDYHQPGDEPQKIDYAHVARVARLVFGTAWEAANRTQRPAVTGEGFGR